jgi:hypothetical protein
MQTAAPTGRGGWRARVRRFGLLAFTFFLLKGVAWIGVAVWAVGAR